MSTRDFVMARLASARYRSNAATESIDGVLEIFIDGAGEEPDIEGEERMEMLELAEVELRASAEALQAAREAMEALTGDELAETELEDEDEDEEDAEGEEPEAA